LFACLKLFDSVLFNLYNGRQINIANAFARILVVHRPSRYGKRLKIGYCFHRFRHWQVGDREESVRELKSFEKLISGMPFVRRREPLDYLYGLGGLKGPAIASCPGIRPAQQGRGVR
jgi:hypothetical protein